MTDLNFKNDKERIAFLDDYRNTENGWYLWKEDDDRQIALWRFDLPGDISGGAIIVEEELRTYEWPERHRTWSIRRWYIITDWSCEKQTFGDQASSRTMALNLIKDIQRMIRDKQKKERRDHES